MFRCTTYGCVKKNGHKGSCKLRHNIYRTKKAYTCSDRNKYFFYGLVDDINSKRTTVYWLYKTSEKRNYEQKVHEKDVIEKDFPTSEVTLLK